MSAFLTQRHVWHHLKRLACLVRQLGWGGLCFQFLCTNEARMGSSAGSRVGFSSLFAALRFPCFQRSEEHTSELQSLMSISYAVFCLKKKQTKQTQHLVHIIDIYV